MDSTLIELYDQAYLPYQSHRLNLELRERVERESKGLLQLVDEIKNKFFGDRDWSELQVAELGAGMGGLSLHLARRGAKVTVVDCSKTALDIHAQLSQMSHLETNPVCLDVSHPEAKLTQKFDLLIDSHLLHCIAQPFDRASYLSFVREHLKPGGFFVGESMVHRKKMFIPPGYRLDEEGILWQKFSEWIPLRKITDSLLLEDEFKNSGFFINYFFYYANFAFAVNQDFLELPGDILPASVRFALRLP
jgi:SAM-dependent methyltransferase